jgi:carbon storage regulator
MLVLNRNTGEAIVIRGRTVVTVSRVAGRRVALGIEAPDDVLVLRSELTLGNSSPAGGAWPAVDCHSASRGED